MTTKHLDIGCCSNPSNPFACDELHGVDIIKQEVSNFILKLLKNIYYTVRYKKKSHFLWKFTAIKK